MSFWFDEIYNNISRFGLNAEEMLFSEQSDYQRVEVLASKGFGRVLAIDKIFMTSELDEYMYHEMIVHPALTTAPRIERILVIGGGDGGTVREVLSYPEVKQVAMVEIDPMVVEACKALMPGIGRGAWSDPRLKVIIDDGLQFVKRVDQGAFDVILLDHSDPVGPAKGLFDEQFYRDCKHCLSANGVFCLQSESPVLQLETFLEIQSTLKRTFERVSPYFGTVPIYASGAWSWTFASDTVDPFGLIEARVSLQEERCRKYNREIHLGAFAMSNQLKKILSGG